MANVPVKIEKRITLDGKNYNQTETDSGNSSVKQDLNIAGAKTAVLTTRTNNTEGTLTGQASHGVTTGSRISIFWDGGSRYNVLVGTVAANSIPISGGAGDNLPVEASNLTIMVETEYDFRFDGDDMIALAFFSGARGRVQIIDDAGDIEYTFITSDVNQVEEWSRLSGITNPLAGDVVEKIKLTHESTSVQQMRCSAVLL